METLTFTVPAMTCDHCKSAIVSEVGTIETVSGVDVNLETKVVTVNGTNLQAAAIIAAIDEAGFDVES